MSSAIRFFDTLSAGVHGLSALSLLSPRDVGEIRDGVVTLDRLVGAQSVPLLPAERADLEQLAALLERNLADDVLP